MITASTLSNNTLTVIIDNGKQILTATKDHPKWNELVTAYGQKNENVLLELLSIKRVIEKFSNNGLSVTDAGIFFREMPLHGVDVDRVMAFLRQGIDYVPIANYMVRKFANPSKRAIDEMYNFLEHKNMPLTPDGRIIAYKGVQKDFFSVSSGNEPLLQGRRNEAGQIFNGVGETIEMLRSAVDDDFRRGCSGGLHAGSLSYAKDWVKDEGIIILIEIDPADVVSVPSDCGCSKLRCCKYKVIGIYDGPLPDAYVTDYSNNVETSLSTDDEKITDEDNYDDDVNDNYEDEELDDNYEDQSVSHLNPIPTSNELNNNGGNSTANVNSIISGSDEDEETLTVIQNPNVFHNTDPDSYKNGYDCGYKHGKARCARMYLKSDVDSVNSYRYEYKRGYHNGYVDGRTDYKIKVYV